MTKEEGLEKSEVFNLTMNKRSPATVDNKVAVLFGDNTTKLTEFMLNTAFRNYNTVILNTTIGLINQASSLSEVLNTHDKEQFTKLILINTGSTNTSNAVNNLNKLIEFASKNKKTLVGYIEMVELSETKKTAIKTDRVPQGVKSSGDLTLTKLRDNNVDPALIFTLRSEILSVDDILVQKALEETIKVIESKSNVTPAIYTTLWDLMELYTEGELAPFNTNNHNFKTQDLL